MSTGGKTERVNKKGYYHPPQNHPYIMPKGTKFPSLPLKAAAEMMVEVKKHWTGTSKVFFPGEEVAGRVSFFPWGDTEEFTFPKLRSQLTISHLTCQEQLDRQPVVYRNFKADAQQCSSLGAALSSCAGSTAPLPAKPGSRACCREGQCQLWAQGNAELRQGLCRGTRPSADVVERAWLGRDTAQAGKGELQQLAHTHHFLTAHVNGGDRCYCPQTALGVPWMKISTRSSAALQKLQHVGSQRDPS